MNTVREKLHDNTVRWARDRGIIQNGTPLSQALKLGSEFGELCNNLAHNKPIADDIGDCLVVCTILAKQLGTHLLTELETITPTIHTTPAVPMLGKYLGDLQDAVAKGHITNFAIAVVNFIHQLEGIALLRHTTLDNSWTIAYDDIKDRVGFLNSDGIFIKSTDDNYEELYQKFLKETTDV